MTELEHRIARIEDQGISKTPVIMREKLLRNLEVPVDRPADVVVITGCNSLLNPLRLMQTANLLNRLAINFTFLSFEYCCFAEVVRDSIYTKDASTPDYEEHSRIWNRRNCARARDLGAHTVINLCAGCNTAYLRSAADLVRPVYYVNFFEELPFAGYLDLKIDLYEGCHKKHNYYPECQARQEITIALLAKIKGLTYNIIPGVICCNKVPDQVLKRASSPWLLAPSACCYSNLKRGNNNPQLEVLDLFAILTKASG